MERKIIKTNVGAINIDCVLAVDLISIIEDIINEHIRPGVTRDMFTLEPTGGYDGYDSYTIMLTAPESDEQYNNRIQKEKNKEHEIQLKKQSNEMKKLLEKKNISSEEKEKLLKYIQGL